ncbi:MAG: zinc ribbon domain-containing protein [Ruminococcaceae bacterium]|nr:zinc ribbon domain-containing protein [Oscillospiraceae bacterium]
MAFLDKINDFAKTATEKTNNAIEITKLSAKVESEQRNLNDIIRKIGEYYVAKIDSGEVLDEEVMKIFEGVSDKRKAIAEMRAEIESLKTPKTSPEIPKAEDSVKFCPFCGKQLDVSAKFCLNCGKQQP